MRADYHMHTEYSHDSACPPEEMILQAIELGLDEIATTEHVDKAEIVDCDYAAYLEGMHALKEKYKDKINIKTGIEFGLQKHTLDAFQKDAGEYDFEFVIGSVHDIDGYSLWDGQWQRGMTQEEIHRLYYENYYYLLSNFKHYNIVGHLDYIKRYDPYGEYPDENVMPYVDKILKLIIADGKGIEVNTSCYKYKVGDLTPSRKILKRYLELGGEILTIGSDAHGADRVGDHFEEVISILKEIGFTKFCTFEKRNPVFHEL